MKNRPIFEIAYEIKRIWNPISPYAKPYLDAMIELNSINDHYMFDSGKSIILYFLANAGSWRGNDARRIKSELKALCNSK